jgi:hypothetical protein
VILVPEKKTVEESREAKREGKAPSTQAGPFVKEEIEHVREGKHGARSTKQAIAIGLSKARKAGVKLPRRKGIRVPRKGKASPTRSRAVRGALKREGRSAASRGALARQARSAARARGPSARKRAAAKAVRTKGPAGRRAAARKAARTRARS